MEQPHPLLGLITGNYTLANGYKTFQHITVAYNRSTNWIFHHFISEFWIENISHWTHKWLQNQLLYQLNAGLTVGLTYFYDGDGGKSIYREIPKKIFN